MYQIQTVWYINIKSNKKILGSSRVAAGGEQNIN
tara:strand:- start:87 stop:188 length:102 start_codon:yes stop_codon:yes gene_type:complete